MTLNLTDNRLKAALDPGRISFLLESKLQSLGQENALIEELFIPRIFPRNDNSYIIQYQVKMKNDEVRGIEKRIYSGHLLTDGAKLPGYVTGNEDKIITDPQTGLLIPIFPFDPSLPALSEVMDSEKLKVILGNHNLLPECNELPSFKLSTNLLAYRLQKRCTLGIQLGYSSSADSKFSAKKVILRVSKRKKVKALSRALNLMTKSGFDKGANDNLTVPEVLATDDKKGLLFIEFVNDSSLHDMTTDGSFDAGCASAAKLIEKVHSLPLSDIPSYNWQDELEMLNRNVKLLSELIPELATLLAAGYSNLEKNADKVKKHEITCIHRDYYDKQVLYSEDRTTLLDCDTLAVGDPAQDYGNFLAHLMLRSRQEPNNKKNIIGGMNAFRQNYRRTENNFQARVKWWTSATLVRLATLYSLRPRWQHLNKGILEDADTVVCGELQKKY